MLCDHIFQFGHSHQKRTFLASEQSCELLQNEEICFCYTWQQRQVTAVTTTNYYTLVTWRCY